jgi:hypothetical protein
LSCLGGSFPCAPPLDETPIGGAFSSVTFTFFINQLIAIHTDTLKGSSFVHATRILCAYHRALQSCLTTFVNIYCDKQHFTLPSRHNNSIIPSHDSVLLSLWYPAEQLHSNDPGVLVHSWSQGEKRSHSSISSGACRTGRCMLLKVTLKPCNCSYLCIL